MALLNRTKTTKQAATSLCMEVAIIPLHQREELRKVTAKLTELEELFEGKTKNIEALHEQRRRLTSRSFIDRLTVKFLSNDTGSESPSIHEQINALNEELQALKKAIEMVKVEMDILRGRISIDVQSDHFSFYRAHVRQVLVGMLTMQIGNDAVINLRETLERNGYVAGSFVPFGLAPWPYWGNLNDSSSLWNLHLADLRERGIIDGDEFDSITSGELSFKA